MNNKEFILLVLILTISVQITRFLPFIIFGNKEKTPNFITYLGRVLPAAMVGLLVFYCIKDYGFSEIIPNIGNAAALKEAFSKMWPALVASAGVVAVHLWKRSTIISIAVGTAIYMILIRII